jgi:AraC-like DNA-binding protein
LLEAFYRSHPSCSSVNDRSGPFQQVVLDDDLLSTFRQVLKSVEAGRVSDERLQHRLMDLLLALAERGHLFTDARRQGNAGRLRTLIGEAPALHWTVHESGRVLGMSEATLRRRLADERVRFEDLLIDVRMHHAMMLLQTVLECSAHRASLRLSVVRTLFRKVSCTLWLLAICGPLIYSVLIRRMSFISAMGSSNSSP